MPTAAYFFKKGKFFNFYIVNIDFTLNDEEKMKLNSFFSSPLNFELWFLKKNYINDLRKKMSLEHLKTETVCYTTLKKINL